jgi:hypothetical protein
VASKKKSISNKKSAFKKEKPVKLNMTFEEAITLSIKTRIHKKKK